MDRIGLSRFQLCCRLLPAALVLFLTAFIFPMTASAHVKWFAHYDVTKPPIKFSEVATPQFFLIFAVSTALLFAIFMVDGILGKRSHRFNSSGVAFNAIEEKWMRLGTGAFLLCTWAIGANILTPDLHTASSWVFEIQLVSAFCVAWNRTCVVSAIGLCVLYVVGIQQYGVFHMLDYLYFIGMAIFLAGISISRFSKFRVAAMTGCLAFSIMWTAIEKFVYPQWTQQVLERHNGMAMGMHFGVFIVLAGFVEFTLAFYLATGRGMLRLGALVLLIVFITAMPAFGRRDVVGHLPLVAMLAVPLMGGDSKLQNLWRLPGKGIAAHASMACFLYAMALGLFFVAYYGVQWLEYSRTFA